MKPVRVRLEGRFITLPPGHPPGIDRLLIAEGAYPQAPNEVLVEKHFAEYQHLKPGDTLELEIPGAPQNVALKVSGIAISAEYLWVSRNELDIMPSPASFGVLWIDREALREYRMRPGVAAGFRRLLGGGGNNKPQPNVTIPSRREVLIRVADGFEPKAVLNEVVDALGRQTLLTTTARDELPQTEILRTDLKSLRGFSIFFPALFLIVGGSVIAVSLSRVIDSQRSIVGTMLAFGVPRFRILLHYLSFSLVVGILGTLSGTLAGVAVGTYLTRAYAEVANVPRLTFALHESLLGLGVLFGLSAAIFAGLFPAWRAASLYPAQAMCPPAPVMGRGVLWLRRLSSGLSLPVRLAIRNLPRRPGRSLASVAGVAAALVLVLAGAGVVDGLNRTVDVLLTGAWQFDLRVDFFEPDSENNLQSTLKQTAGIERMEFLFSQPARIHAGEIQLETVVEGISPDSKLLKPMNAEGNVIRPKQGVVLPEALARQLKVKVGDTVQIHPLPQGNEIRLKIDGVTTGLGAEVFMQLKAAQKNFASSGQVNSVLIQTNSPAWKVRQSLQMLPEVARVQDVQELREQITTLMDFNYLLVGCMLAFSAILGIAILFTTSTLNVWERRRELATMRTLGLPFRRIAGMMTFEHSLLGLAGIAVGIPFGIWAMRAALNLYENDFLTLPLVLKPATFALAIGNILLVLLLAQWPALRTVAKQNLADTVREREQG